MEDNKDKEYISVPYIFKTISTSVNGETVWYSNKWKNLLLKIKHFFFKPKCFKNANIYNKKIISHSYYGVCGDEGEVSEK